MKIDLQLPKVHDMTTDTVDIISTSAVTADVSPIVLSQTELLRFKFLPTLVDNEKEPHKSVSGKLLYEKKEKVMSAFLVTVQVHQLRFREALLKLEIGWSSSLILAKHTNYTKD